MDMSSSVGKQTLKMQGSLLATARDILAILINIWRYLVLHQESQLCPRRPNLNDENFSSAVGRGAAGGLCSLEKYCPDSRSGNPSFTGEGSSSCMENMERVSMSSGLCAMLSLEAAMARQRHQTARLLESTRYFVCLQYQAPIIPIKEIVAMGP